MQLCSIHVLLENSNRVAKSLFTIEQRLASQGRTNIRDLLEWPIGQVYPWQVFKDGVKITVIGDYGRYDSEGHKYLTETLGVIPGDIIDAWLER